MSARLDGRRVLITREADRAASVVAAVRARGGTPILFPTIATFPPEDPGSLRAAAGRLEAYDWVAVSSRTGVAALAGAVAEVGGRLEVGGRPRYAAVGAGTAQALRLAGANPSVVPSRQDADGLLDAMRAAGAAEGHVLVVRAEAGRDVLLDGLRASGARVDFVVAYRTATACPSAAEVAALRAGGPPDAALFMSPSAFRGLVGILGDGALSWLRGVRCVAIGDITAQAMTHDGRPPDAVSLEPTVEAMLDCVANAPTSEESAVPRQDPDPRRA